MSPNEIGALNIKIEHVLFRLYNNIDLKTPFTQKDGYERLLMAILLMLTDRLVTSFLITLI
jgi:hypothetical protein